jgi:hypothetical protein
MGVEKEIKRETTVKETTIETTTENCSTDVNQSDIQKLLDECQTFHYSQSSSFSKLARTLVFGIIGTIWVLAYSTEGFSPSNDWLLWALIVAFLYIVVDVCHYFFDACFYRGEYFQFDKEKDISEHDKRMDKRAHSSFYAICGKFIILCFVCLLFIVGFIKQYDVISELFC